MIEMEDLKRGVKKYATPLYVYDLDAVEETLTAVEILGYGGSVLCNESQSIFDRKDGKIRRPDRSLFNGRIQNLPGAWYRSGKTSDLRSAEAERRYP